MDEHAKPIIWWLGRVTRAEDGTRFTVIYCAEHAHQPQQLGVRVFQDGILQVGCYEHDPPRGILELLVDEKEMPMFRHFFDLYDALQAKKGPTSTEH